MPSVQLTKSEFAQRFRSRFYDPAFDTVADEIDKVIEKAWDGYHQYRKSACTRKAGRGFGDPSLQIAGRMVGNGGKKVKSTAVALAHSFDQWFVVNAARLLR